MLSQVRNKTCIYMCVVYAKIISNTSKSDLENNSKTRVHVSSTGNCLQRPTHAHCLSFMLSSMENYKVLADCIRVKFKDLTHF